MLNKWHYTPNSLQAAYVYQAMRKRSRAAAAFDSARRILKRRLAENPDDERIHLELGLAYAGLGLRSQAIREGKIAVQSWAARGHSLILDRFRTSLATIYLLLGDHDQALELIADQLSKPSRMSIHLLQLHPLWDPVRDHPRYLRLVQQYGDVQTQELSDNKQSQ